MTRRKIMTGALAAFVLAGSGLWMSRCAEAIPVFDSANYAENVVQAARALAQINNQITSLQNETVMLQNMAKNLQRLDFSAVTQMTAGLQQVDTLMQQAQGISYNVNSTTSSFQSLYPQQYSSAVTSDQLVMDARARWRESMNNYQHTMSVQSQVVQNVQADRGVLTALVNQSQNAEGALQAQQATNQLLALSNKQQMQIQAMMASQFRAEAAEQARAAESQEQGRSAVKRFLGSRHMYTPN